MAVEGILAKGVTEILKKLSSVVVNEITLVWDFNDELKNLQSTLNMLMAVMEDAENKQLSSKTVRLWMEDLKAIAYDAEDILDDYSYKIICKRTQTGEVGKPSLFFRWRMAHKVKKINENLNEITKRKNGLGLQTIDLGSSSSQHELMMKNRETNSFVPQDWKIVGIENDKSTIIKMLLEEEEYSSNINQGGGGGKHVSVIPIVGMGGLGKTTMAQQVYNDEAIQKHFPLKIWICVSDPFDIKKLYKNIANSIGIAKQYDDATTMDDIACLLGDAFKEKKFILVLDDVWNENRVAWYKFKTPLMFGAEGSKILVTTRSIKVAKLMEDKYQPYQLGILNDNDSWSLFKEVAFGFNAGATETPKLMEIGKEMVKRCGGLPLGVIFLGSLMGSKKKEEEWKIIRDTKLWHESREGKNSEILPSLRLSYDYLPSHLKLCFSYCCLFPKDSIIKRERLIRLWMAEGFLIETPGENTMSMEEIGNEYFHSLVSSFFFQDVKKDDDGDILTCKMHDLVHDLARSVVGNHECLIVENALDIGYISEATCRLNLLVDLNDEEMLAKVLEALKKAKNLRTVFVNNQQPIGFDIGNAFKENKRLRVLDLGWSNVMTESTSSSSSSSSIGGLKHLRYLYLPKECIIPKGIGHLRFLQTLSWFNVGDKKKNKNAAGGIEELEGELEGLNLVRFTSIGNLENVTSGTDACRANLTLSWFNVGDKKKKNKNAAGGIEELEGLNLVRFTSIGNLQNVTSGTDACRANLKEKKNLRVLNLTWDRGGYVNPDANNNDEAVVLEGLRPHSNLRYLWIEGFEGAKLPRWIEDSSCLPNLVELILWNNYNCKKVAGFGALPSLRSLTLAGMDNLECIGNEFYYSAAATVGRSSTTTTIPAAFPSLKKLSLSNMDSLKEWVVPVPVPSPQASTTGAATTNYYCFALLEEINIESCPLLSSITPTTTIFPSLKVLNLEHMDGRAAKTLVTNNLNSLTYVKLFDIPNLISLPRQGLIKNNNTLLTLQIEGCHEFEGFFQGQNDDDDQGGGGFSSVLKVIWVS